MEWQPIETAPKDGSAVILVRKWADHMAICFYNETFDEWVSRGSVPFHNATHWTHLPPPPPEYHPQVSA